MKTTSQNSYCMTLREKARCSACGGRIGRVINLVALAYWATWEYPTGGNIMTGERGQAVAVCCEVCIDNYAPIREAVELRGVEVLYHPVTELEAIK